MLPPTPLPDAPAFEPTAFLPLVKPALRKVSRLVRRLPLALLLLAAVEGALSSETLGWPVAEALLLLLPAAAAVEDDLSLRSWSWRLLRGVTIADLWRGHSERRWARLGGWAR